ncbi:N-acetylgalactosamine-6-O-sulfatase [Dyadobacter sp. CECT 9275]|uniref:N-acetylgalactosamine-6-O-sulfatase n=1 Tax=Dyadobacter helix TaxID=2822344 RepID=A0A916JHX2_9BACT|nr:arylsulfatase [Dyadobacter sp. CECT 9275]CAG5018047.1 N-acetylgalactosamine-6-O-sulfatase [Dyadobacter sp. CECT 9275]
MKQILCLLLLSFITITTVAQKKRLPNIVYILADDLGYGDVSIYNPSGKISTPNIDRLASQGMRFTDAHSPSSVCTPTRYSLMTGRYPWRSRLPVGVLRGYSQTLIEEDRQTVASLLKSHGYQTGVIGKWHLGLGWVSKPAYHQLAAAPDYGIKTEMDPQHIDFARETTTGPKTAGFDYSYVLPASLDMPPYCYLENQKLTEPLTAYTDGNKLTSGYTGPFWREGKMSPSFDFLQVLPTFIQKATDFIGLQSKEKPFFLYLPMPAPHTPWMPTADYKGKSGAGEYGDFVQQVDGAVGQILKTLQEKGFSDNTLVIFTSDNGPYWRPNFVEQFGHKAAGPFRGMKGDAFEGGHRIPFIVRWPGKVKAGTISNATTTLANLMATCQQLTGETSPVYNTEDSYSILDVLLGKSKEIATQPAVVHSSSIGFFAIRKGDWKLIEGLGSGGFTEPRKINETAGQPAGQLFNLATDISETEDLYARYPDKVKELKQLLTEIKNSKTKVTGKQ